MVWIPQDPVLYMLLCSANLDKLPLNLTFPSTDCNVSEPHLHQMSKYNLPYSFWGKKNQNHKAQSSTALFPHFDQKSIPYRAGSDVTWAPSRCSHPGRAASSCAGCAAPTAAVHICLPGKGTHPTLPWAERGWMGWVHRRSKEAEGSGQLTGKWPQLLKSNAGLQPIWHAVTSNAEAGKDRCVCWQQLPASKKGGSGWGHAGTHERAVVEPGVGSFRDFSLPSFASIDKLFCKSLKLRSGFLLCLKPLASSTPVLDDTRTPGLSSQGCTELSEKAREEQLDDPSQQRCNSHWGKAEQSSFKALLTHRAQRLGWGCSSPLRQQKHLSLTLLLLSV